MSNLRLRSGRASVLLAAMLVGAPLFAQDDGWTLDAELDAGVRVTAAENAVRDDDDTVDDDAISFSLSPQVTATNGPVEVALRHRVRRIEYFDDDREDLWRNLLGAEVTYTTDPMGAVSVFAERGWNVSTAEFPRADQWEAGAEIERRFGAAHRVRVGGSWRERSYDDLAGSEGSGPRLDAQYRYRFAANHYLYVAGRVEEIDSDAERREMNRWLLSASYQRPLARDLRIRPQLTYRELDFPGRIVPDGASREDTILIPEVTLLYSPGDWLFSGELRYNIRSSNDPERGEDGFRISVNASHEF
ncbi:hypothetical protein HME9302_01340 [Alteripontixanthobacter maritimus]|uniref:DUF481 domain-containing protein n=1 Tax=Alteripontixanthobacter maritimus TaxID=2161824 RepID=A0A369Q5G9_9SPHN|nr:hypothetical protein [Alteripontixanthobacter maritimus]RDC60141.1 hypothetical protein HME9302_01340 [Alteripontixanthobacter maritimus]